MLFFVRFFSMHEAMELGSCAPIAENKSGEDDCSHSPFGGAILGTLNEVATQNSEKII